MTERTGLPKCFDCKWPYDSKVAKACPCRGGDSKKHAKELVKARELQDKSTPMTDEKYYA